MYECIHGWILGTATPREALKFSANLRLDAHYSEEEIDRLVQDMLESLGIDDCADTMIGIFMYLLIYTSKFLHIWVCVWYYGR